MFTKNEPVLPPGKTTVVVSGVGGFVGSHVASQLLDAGYVVRGTTRDGLKNEWISKFFANKYGSEKFELITIPRFDEPGAFDAILQGLNAYLPAEIDMKADDNNSYRSLRSNSCCLRYDIWP